MGKIETRDFTLNETEYVVIRPTIKIQNEANKVRNKTFAEAVNSGCLLRDCLDSHMRQQGLWNDNKEMEYRTLRRNILDSEMKLKKGGIKLSEAEHIAREMKQNRIKMADLLSARTRLDSNTVEGQADNMRFNYLVSACTVYKNGGKCVFKNLDDYLNRADDELSERAAYELYLLLFDQKDNPEKELPENKFLVRFGFMNSSLQWTNKEGELVDEEGRRVDKEGRYIDENGNFVDVDGNLVDENGEPLIDTEPFLDEAGNPIE